MGKPKVRIGFVGVGTMGQCAHLRNYVLEPDCEVVAIAELRSELAERVAARYGIERVYPGHREMLAAERLDGLVAPQPFTTHGRLVPELLASGLPLLTEKPLARSLRAGEALLEALRGSEGLWMIGNHKRSDPAVRWAIAEITQLKGSGELGRMTYVRVEIPPGEWINSGFDDLIRTDEPKPQTPGDPVDEDLSPEENSRYEAFVNYYIHQVNLIRYLLGEDYQVTYADPSGVLLAGRSAGGVPCLLEMEAYRTTVAWHERALVAFERGYLEIRLPAPLARNRPGSVTVYRDPGAGAEPERVSPELPRTDAMRQQARQFIKAIRGEEPPPCDAFEAMKDLRVARQYLDKLEEVR